MQRKHIYLLILIVIIAVCFVGCVELEDEGLPETTIKEFPVYVKYSIGDDVFVIEDTVICEFYGLVQNQG